MRLNLGGVGQELNEEELATDAIGCVVQRLQILNGQLELRHQLLADCFRESNVCPRAQSIFRAPVSAERTIVTLAGTRDAELRQTYSGGCQGGEQVFG